jgi:DNA-binding NarL/FixJ family response regulator
VTDAGTLSPQRREICRRIALGETNKEIAHALGLSEQTTKWHVSQLLRAFGVVNRAALAAKVASSPDADRVESP